MRFIEDRGSTFARQNKLEDEEVNHRRNGFAWMIVIIVLLGLNIGSWAFCNMVFGHPEHPFSYGLLTKLDKLEPLEGYRTTTVPGGDFMTAKEFYIKAYPFSNSQLRAYNGLLLRNYLWNYSDRDPAYFMQGKFIVDRVETLGAGDMFPQGIAVYATADRFPDTQVELILPSVEPVSEVDFYQSGDVLIIGRSDFAASVIHAKRTGKDDPMVFTCVPLVTKEMDGSHRNFKTPSGNSLKLQTPEWLTIAREAKANSE